jgi:hypothetical protein
VHRHVGLVREEGLGRCPQSVNCGDERLGLLVLGSLKCSTLAREAFQPMMATLQCECGDGKITLKMSQQSFPMFKAIDGAEMGTTANVAVVDQD